MKWTRSIKEAIGTSVQELSKAVEDRTLWTPLIHRVEVDSMALHNNNNLDMKHAQKQCKKRKLEANIIYEHRR